MILTIVAHEFAVISGLRCLSIRKQKYELNANHLLDYSHGSTHVMAEQIFALQMTGNIRERKRI